MTRAVVAALVLAVLVACGSGDGEAPGASGGGGTRPTGEPWFVEDAERSGLRWTHQSDPERRWWFPEIMGGGTCLIDHDDDGDLDVYLVQSGDLDPRGTDKPRNRLFENAGDGTFTDVTERAGGGDDGYGMGCAVGDYDGDGDEDLYVTNVGPNVLYRNDGGRFTDVTAEAGVGDAGWGTSAGFLDVDADGRLDLFVVNYVIWSIERDVACYTGYDAREYCSPIVLQAPARDVLYHSQGDGSFRDATEAAGLSAAFGNGLGFTAGDYDLDGDVDVYVANDASPNQLWLNDGSGRFTDHALVWGCAVNAEGSTEAGMGVTSVDVDGDGDLELFMTHLYNESNTFYRNDGRWFVDATSQAGLAAPSIDFTGFGTGFADFDQDGRVDAYVANGRVKVEGPPTGADDPYAEPNQVFSLSDEGRFVEQFPRGGTAGELVHASRAAAFGDLDGDGDVDVIVVNKDGPAYFLRNEVSKPGGWIGFDVRGADGRRVPFANVQVSSGDDVQWRPSQVAYSYCASSEPRVHFGLGKAGAADEVIVRWPDGARESFGSLAAGATHELRRGRGRPAGT